MTDAAEVWQRILNLEPGEDPAPLILELNHHPDAADVVKSTLVERRRRSLTTLARPEFAQLATKVLPSLVYFASTAHRDILLVREVIRGIPKQELEDGIWPLAQRHVSLDAWEEPRRFAELFTELRLRRPLAQLLEAISGSENVDWQEVEEEYKPVLESDIWDEDQDSG
jgi:hypothetical protein